MSYGTWVMVNMGSLCGSEALDTLPCIDPLIGIIGFGKFGIWDSFSTAPLIVP